MISQLHPRSNTSRVANLPNTSGAESRSGYNRWYYIVTKYPKVPDEYYNHVTDPNLKQICKHSRPLFGLHLAENLNEHPTKSFDEICSCSFSNIRQ